MSETEQRQTVLVVDDVVENCILLADYLENLGCEVVTANSGAEAMAYVEKGRAKGKVVVKVR